MRLTGAAVVAGVLGLSLLPVPATAAPLPAVASPAGTRLSPAQVALASVAASAPSLASGSSLRVASEVPGAGGGSVVRLQESVGGIPVFGGESVVALDGAGQVRLSLSERASAAPATLTPRVSPARAARVAVLSAQGAAGARAATPTLWVYDPAILDAPGPRRPTLVWRTEVTSPADRSLRRLVLVDASTGKVALAFNQTERLGRWVCDNGDDPTLTGECTTPVRVEGTAATGRADVDSAYAFAGSALRFLSVVLGRNGLDGHGQRLLGGTLRSTVRYCPSGDGTECPYANAFWDGRQMLYGAGYASAQDVVAHELMHGVTQFGPRLFYYHQSGAINESISDVLGEMVDQWSTTREPGVTDTDLRSVRWLMGEDLPEGALRSLATPEVDRMSSPAFVTSEDDLGGVHANAGVGSKFAVLLTDGGRFNGRTVRGVGLAKAAQIVYTASQLLTSAADYPAYAKALGAACRSLVGGRLTPAAGIITADDCAQVSSAVAAVEMTRGSVAEPVGLCPAGLRATALYRDAFERGAGGWVRGGLRDWYHSQAANPYGFDAVYATSGRGSLWGNNGNRAGSSTMSMRRDVTLPRRSGTRYVVRFNHAYGFWPSDGTTAADGGVLELSVDHGRTWRRVTQDRWSRAGGVNGYTGRMASGTTNPIGGSAAFVGHSRGYLTSRFDVTDLAGGTVRLRFRVAQMAKDPSDPGDLGWFVDDVAVLACR